MPTAHNRYFCAHAHFYQPPRVNPFTGTIPVEAGAEPYANYNEKINAECYRPNARLGNFRRVSFDIGPTLTDWLAQADPLTLGRMVRGDRWAIRHHGGSPALAQSYHHTILPLDSERDRRTQVRWGVRDFQFRFGHSPVGFWLPETAVDLVTLELLANEGIRFTILAPYQTAEPVLPGQPYNLRLPSGRCLAAFFYDADLSAQLSFQPEISTSAPRFVVEHVQPRYHNGREPQLVLLATDGELYGHHQPFRDLFLQDLYLHRLPAAGIRPITPDAFLRIAPPRPAVTILEGTAWSCPHQLARWRGQCDCVPGTGVWKTDLRAALDAIRDQIDDITVAACADLIHNVWAARDDYIDVVLGVQHVPGWLARHARRPIDALEQERVRSIMEAQRYRMAMYASCAWFWEDLDRIEPTNALANALQAIRLIENATGARLEFTFRQSLASIVSWKTGRSAAEVLAPMATAD